MNRTQTDPEKIHHTIIPAAACLTLLTVGSLSIYGSFDFTLPLIVAIVSVFVVYFVILKITPQNVPV